MSDNHDTFRKIFGNKHSDSSDKFDIELLKIQEKYKIWFENNNGEHEDGSQKTILDHRTVYITDLGVGYKIDFENIPREILNNIDYIFNELFKEE